MQHLISSGTGASAIYPLLYTAIDNHVRVIGTGRRAIRMSRNYWTSILTITLHKQSDINEQSLKVARGNVENNKLSERIALLHVSPDAGYFDEVLKHTPQSVWLWLLYYHTTLFWLNPERGEPTQLGLHYVQSTFLCFWRRDATLDSRKGAPSTCSKSSSRWSSPVESFQALCADVIISLFSPIVLVLHWCAQRNDHSRWWNCFCRSHDFRKS